MIDTGSGGAPRPRVLVAEDDDDMRALLCEVFERDGYEVQQVEDGLELADCLEECAPHGSLPPPDVLVSDIRMPGRTALEVLEQFRGRRCKVVLITAFGDAKTHLQGTQLGAAAVLDKPVDLDLLRTTVRGLLTSP